MARCLSVCLFVCHTPVLSLNGYIYTRNFFTIGEPHHSSFLIPNGMSIFQQGPPLTRASNARGIKQEAQLWQRDRATRMHSVDYTVARCLSVCLSVCHTPVLSLNGYRYPQSFFHHQLYLVPFSSYLTLNNIVTLKSGLEVTQGH